MTKGRAALLRCWVLKPLLDVVGVLKSWSAGILLVCRCYGVSFNELPTYLCLLFFVHFVNLSQKNNILISVFTIQKIIRRKRSRLSLCPMIVDCRQRFIISISHTRFFILIVSFPISRIRNSHPPVIALFSYCPLEIITGLSRMQLRRD